jgi:leucyl aminopeptidase
VTQEGAVPLAMTDVDARLGGEILRLRDSGDLTGKHLEIVTILSPRGLSARRLLLVGLGAIEKLTRSVVHDAFAAALRSITGRKFGRVALALPSPIGGVDQAAMALAVGVGAIQGCFGPGIRKSEASRHAPDEIAIVGDISPQLIARVRAEGAALTLARNLVNAPPCDLFPESFARIAAEPVAGVECEIWDEHRLERERMGAILGVAAAAARPARLVILRYRNAGDAPILAFVGKGVTFDSGGLSLKTNEQMMDMKGDMAGAAAVLAAIRAVAELQLPVNLLGVMPLVENMPGGRALKLGDVLRARNGKTIEVLNTDAEGRLILADALAYAAEQRPGHIVDLATLTGSCMIALGTEIAGLMTNNPAWGERIRSAVQRTGERVWPLPMDADFGELLKSNVADIKNVGPTRYGGAIAGGKFLEQFVGDVPWTHLDIAGPAWADHESACRDAGGTGAFVRSLVELAASYST